MTIKTPNAKTTIYEYTSIGDLLTYLNNTPQNPAWHSKSSTDNGSGWTGTQNYAQAEDMLRNGWSPAAEKLALALSSASPATTVKTRPTYSPVGYAPSVPRYLNNMPDAMISSRRTTQKIPVVTINKDISWSSFYSAETIHEEGVKLLQHIKSIEDSGTRVRLNIVWSVRGDRNDFTTMKVCIKEPNERLNIAKMAFPLVHPSMLRRIGFAWIERNAHLNYEMSGYGMPDDDGKVITTYYPNEQFIPKILRKQG